MPVCLYSELRVDGGATINNVLMQFQCDLLGTPVIRPKITETTALGAAYLAGLAMGYWSNLEEIQAQWQVDATFTPSVETAQRNEWARRVATRHSYYPNLGK